jgi:Rhodopirellula transposase DDE domain
MDERLRRYWAASEERAYGRGGIRTVSTATGLAANTIRKGLAELADQDATLLAPLGKRLRRAGAGRKRHSEKDPQLLENLRGIPIHVCHFPPGTSKWNKIEHRMFSHITQNWRGQPLISHEVIVQLIANTTTRTGLKIRAELDRGRHPAGIKVSDAELAAANLERADFHGDWNYTLEPDSKS